ncbi:P-loop containing nucleoside triphosphate hydrolase protein [Mycena rosella]|uniref:P-loop containing nucleoside triphosphate hydrolase protein n=1 Tax=Mycena rosella TaxID=1033263 RepID=A0AAD7DKU7_MYCRO|nr:P-loop containing nucleoside triphosphate hydrolase protein [Mycena rosella]
MYSEQLSALPYLTHSQKAVLKKGNLQTIPELLFASPQDLARRCRISPLEAKAIFNTVCENNPPQIISLAEEDDQEQICSTGDAHLDAALGGGLRTGMLWEIFGQSAAGKTQMALQLSLFAQVPASLGGLSGSACYITISSKLPTSRLLQIVDAHPLLSREICGLDDINTMKTPTIPVLIHVLSKILPDLVAQRVDDPELKPVKLVIIDALAELFHSSDKTTTTTLIERSQNIAEISTLLHVLASKYNLAVLVLNEVSDVFNHGESGTSSSGGLVYNQQAKWFGAADTVPGESNKEASLGLVWANQVNARIMMSRTGRRRYLEDSLQNKRQKADDGHSSGNGGATTNADDGAILVRRLSVVFSSVAPPSSVDYIVTAAGISVLPDDDVLAPAENAFSSPERHDDAISAISMAGSQVAPLDVGFAEQEAQSERTHLQDEDEEWENYWNADVISEEMYTRLEEPGE